MAEKTKKVKLPSIEEMFKAGVHLGHRSFKRHPKMEPYIFSARNAIHIIDLEKTLPLLEKALVFLKEVASEKGDILFVGTKSSIKKIVQETAESLDMPYVNERWLGGTLTNFKTIAKRLEYFRDLEKKKQSGELNKYTKKERLEFDKELERLEKNFGGIKKLTKKPSALFISDARENILAVKEAKKMGLPVVALCDTNADPSLVDYPIPANDDALSAVSLILETIKKNIKK